MAPATLGFFDDLQRIFVVSHGYKLRMPKMIGTCPLKEVDPHHSFGTKPNALLHLFGREPLSPTPGALLWKIRKWTMVGLQVLELGKYLMASRRYEASPHTRRVDKLVVRVESDDKGVKSMRASRLAAYHKFLT